MRSHPSFEASCRHTQTYARASSHTGPSRPFLSPALPTAHCKQPGNPPDSLYDLWSGLMHSTTTPTPHARDAAAHWHRPPWQPRRRPTTSSAATGRRMSALARRQLKLRVLLGRIVLDLPILVSSRRRHTLSCLVPVVQPCVLPILVLVLVLVLALLLSNSTSTSTRTSASTSTSPRTRTRTNTNTST